MSKNSLQLELSRPLIVERVSRKGSHEHVVAEPAELVGLAKRFAIPALHSLDARFLSMPWRGGGLKVTATIVVDVEQISVVSLEQFRRTETFQVLRYFLPPKLLHDAVEDDADPIENGEIDLGEIAAETLGLELDAYPRKGDEAFVEPDESAPKE